MSRNFRKAPADGSDGSPPSETWLHAQLLLGKPIPDPYTAAQRAKAQRERLEWLASISTEHEDQLRKVERAEAEALRERERLEWLASISTEHEDKLHAVLREEAEAQEAQDRWERIFELSLQEQAWDESKHPRQGGPPNPGWWASTGGSSAGAAGVQSAPLQTAGLHAGQATTQLAAFGGAGTWPTTGPMPSWLPKVDVRPGAGAATAAGAVFDAIAISLRNASMGAYWARVPAVQAMPQFWVYELEKRVRAGKLSHEDAVGIFNTAVLGAQAQGFKPAGGTPSAIQKSCLDFLAKAEAVYFARKNAAGWAQQPGGYQQSGGQVFPTKRNSGLDGFTLRREQEKFFERGLQEGKDPGYLRGQASEAGVERHHPPGQPDHLADAEAEAALQRALQKTKK